MKNDQTDPWYFSIDSVYKESKEEPWIGIIIRSPVAQKRLLSIDYGAPLPHDEVFWVVTEEHLGSENYFSWAGGELPILAKEILHYIGQPIILIAAKTETLLKTVSEKITFEFGPLTDDEKETLTSVKVVDKVQYHWNLAEEDKDEIPIDDVREGQVPIFLPSFDCYDKEAVTTYFHRKESSYYVKSSARWNFALINDLSRVLRVHSSRLHLLNSAPNYKNIYPVKFWLAHYHALCASLLSMRSQKSIRLLPAFNNETPPIFKTPSFHGDYLYRISGHEQSLKIDITLKLGHGSLGWKEYQDRILSACVGGYRWHRVDVSLNIEEDSSRPPHALGNYFGSHEVSIATQNLMSRLLLKENIEVSQDRKVPLGSFFYKENSLNILGMPERQRYLLDKRLEKNWKKYDFLRKITSRFLTSDEEYHTRGIGGSQVRLPLYPLSLISRKWHQFYVILHWYSNLKVEIVFPARPHSQVLLGFWRRRISEKLNLSPESIYFLEDVQSYKNDTGPLFEDQSIAYYHMLLEELLVDIEKKFQERSEREETFSLEKRVSLKRSTIYAPEEAHTFLYPTEVSGSSCYVSVEYNRLRRHLDIKEISYELEYPFLPKTIVRDELREVSYRILRSYPETLYPYCQDSILSSDCSQVKIGVSFLETKEKQERYYSLQAPAYLNLLGAMCQAIQQVTGASVFGSYEN